MLLVAYFLVAIVLDHAHLMCPIWLGWSNKGFRAYMLTRPEKFLLLPVLCVVVALAIGEEAETTHDLAFRVLAGAYVWWNAWHFGSQHFGVASLLGWQWGTRWARQMLIILPTMCIVLVPKSGLVPLLIVNEIINLAHWATDIGLTTRVLRSYLFLAGVLIVGLIGFCWKTVTTDPHLCGPLLPVCSAQWSIPTLLALRYGLGFWHFLMSRWVWQLSDPQVRATIGSSMERVRFA